MDGGSGEPVAWRSSIPGVSQRDGAPASLGVAGRGGRAPALGERGVGVVPNRDGDPVIGASGDVPLARRARRRVVPWRALGLAVVALVALVGVARAAGVDTGVAVGAASGAPGSGWETVDAVDGSAPRPRGRSDPGPAGGPSAMPDPVAPSSRGIPTPEAPEPVADLGEVPPGDEPPVDEPPVDEPPGGEPPGDEPPGDEPPGDDESPDWWTVLAELDARRVRALTEVDPSLLPTYAQPESTAWQQDAALLADLSGRGLRPEGLTSRVLAVERIDDDAGRARLQLVDERSGYSLVDSQGAVLQEVGPAGPRRWAVTLVRLAPTATGTEPVDPAADPEGSAALDSSGPPENNAVPSPSSGRDPGWRVVTVVPVPSADARDAASDGADEGAAGSPP